MTHCRLANTESEKFSYIYIFLLTGDYGKLGHGNSSTQKLPKLIQSPFTGKVGTF